MIELFGTVQEVKLVGGEDWLSHNLGSILLAVAAFVAAGLAAWVATRNTRMQLEHDRSLRNQDHIRDTIDAAVASVSEAVMGVTEFSSSVTTIEIWRKTADEVLSDDSSSDAEKAAAIKSNKKWRNELIAERDACYPKLSAMRAVNFRLDLRLGDKHPIVVTHDATREALLDLYTESTGGVAVARDQATSEGDDDRIDAVGDAFRGFRDACSAWFNE